MDSLSGETDRIGRLITTKHAERCRGVMHLPKRDLYLYDWMELSSVHEVLAVRFIFKGRGILFESGVLRLKILTLLIKIKCIVLFFGVESFTR